MRIYDPEVETARLVGGNRAYVERHLLTFQADGLFARRDRAVRYISSPPLKEASLIDRWLKKKEVLDLRQAISR